MVQGQCVWGGVIEVGKLDCCNLPSGEISFSLKKIGIWNPGFLPRLQPWPLMPVGNTLLSQPLNKSFKIFID